MLPPCNKPFPPQTNSGRDMSERSVIESACVVIAGIASAIVIYEWWFHHGSHHKSAPASSPAMGYSQTYQPPAFMGGLFGSAPAVTNVERVPNSVIFT